jgi:hypothetical protein
MKLASEKDLQQMKAGTPLLVNIADTICDIGLFVSYDEKTKKILVQDSFLKNKNGQYFGNLCEYTRVFDLSDQDFTKM